MISKILRYMRRTANLNQQELAKKMNVAPTTISGYETDYSQPRFDIIEEIADKCGFDVEFINRKTKQVITTKNIDREEI